MATALRRGLQGGVFRTASFSCFTRWTSLKTPDKRGRIALQSADYYKKVGSHDGDLPDRPSDYHPTSAEKWRPQHDYQQHDYQQHDYQQHKYATGRPRIKKLSLPSHPREKQSENFAKIYRKSRHEDMFDDVESYSSMADPRGFQQSRAEYKSLCYSLGHIIETSKEEGETLLQQVACHDPSPTEISNFWEKLSCVPEDHMGALKSSEHFENLCGCSIEALQLYTHQELIRILAAFVRLKIPAHHPILKACEKEFSRRVWYLSTNELLLVADMWRCLSFSVPKFLDIMYSYMHLRSMDLTLAQAIQLIYIIGEGRRAPDELMEKLEAIVLRFLQKINLEEIGTVCLGFFKTGHGLSEYLMRKFGDMIVGNIDDLSNYSLVNVLKMFRFTRVDHVDFFSQVGQVSRQRIPNMGIQGIMHVTLSFASMHILDEDLMNTVALVIPDRVSYCRSKDIAKLLWSFGILTYNPPNADVFYSALINEIYKNLQEFQNFPEHFLTCLMALAFCQRFPQDLIKVALSEAFLIQSTKISLFELKKDLFTIAGSVEIECPEYTGETISPELRQEVTEMLLKFSKLDIYVKKEALEAASMLEVLLGGPEFIKHHMILPHTRSKDLEVHFDINNKPIPINASIVKAEQSKKPIAVQVTDDLMNQLLNKNLKPPPDDTHYAPNIKGSARITNDLLSQLTTSRKPDKKPVGKIIKLALQVTNRNHYCYGRKRLLGLHDMKRRQLQKLGYVVVELPYWEWYPLTKCSQSEQLSYLHYKVFESLDRGR